MAEFSLSPQKHLGLASADLPGPHQELESKNFSIYDFAITLYDGTRL